ncbi:hypothetical protein GCM10017673_20440 [Streptosporangium violaceochromogenes]|nr:hypothetical protein GCM10017673_20440 [Streptosporangium violaceochromogenes]
MTPRFRGGPIAGAGTLVALVLAGHGLLPNRWGMGNVLDSALPWLGLAVPVLALAALAGRTRLASAGVVIPAVTWAVIFGPAFARTPPSGPRDLRVVHQNVNLANGDLARTARALRATGADVLVAVEVPDDPVLRNGTVHPAFAGEIDPAYPYRFPDNPGVAVWSRYPVLGTPRPVPGVERSRWAILRTPWGPVSLYAVHLASFRPGRPSVIALRNAEAEALARAIRADHSPLVVVAGDLNTAATDREMGPLTETLTSVADQAGTGLQFTWPAPLPVVRLDHVLVRGFAAVASRVLPASVSDHRAILADLRVPSPRPVARPSARRPAKRMARSRSAAGRSSRVTPAAGGRSPPRARATSASQRRQCRAKAVAVTTRPRDSCPWRAMPGSTSSRIRWTSPPVRRASQAKPYRMCDQVPRVCATTS